MELGQVNLLFGLQTLIISFPIQDGHTSKLLACTVAVSPCFTASLLQRAADELILVVINFLLPCFSNDDSPTGYIWGQSISHRFQHQFKLNHNVRY